MMSRLFSRDIKSTIISMPTTSKRTLVFSSATSHGHALPFSTALVTSAHGVHFVASSLTPPKRSSSGLAHAKCCTDSVTMIWRLKLAFQSFNQSNSSFHYSGPAAWNTLPSDLHDITDTNVFKKRLKTVLFDRAYWLIIVVVRRSWMVLRAAPYKIISHCFCICICMWSTTTRTRVSDLTAVTFSVKWFNPLKLYPLSGNIFRKWFASYFFFIYSRNFNNSLNSFKNRLNKIRSTRMGFFMD